MPLRPFLCFLILAATLAGCREQPTSEVAIQTEPAATPSVPGGPATSPAPAAQPKSPLAQEEFFEAALNGDLQVVKSALASGTKAEQTDGDGRTALMLASYNGHSAIAGELLAAGAPVDARDQTGRTALMYSCTADNQATVALLLKHHAGVNLVDGNEHWSPLMFAAAEGQGVIVRLLLAAGADPTAADVDGETAALFATNRGHHEVAKVINEALAGR